jgi:hypothetical protein
MISITTFAYSREQFERFLIPTDADGMYCGIDYPDYPYVYYAIQVRSVVTVSPLVADLHVTPVCSNTCPTESRPAFSCKTVQYNGDVTAFDCETEWKAADLI